MQLSEGQVMDFTKSTTPYMDERFKAGYVPVEQAPEPARLESTTQTREPSVESCVIISPNTIPLPPQQQDQQWIQQPFNPFGPYAPAPLAPVQVPYVPQQIFQSLPDVSSEVFGKVQARKEALEAMDDKTPEMNATIKALEWVLSAIVRARTTCALSQG